MTTVIIRIENGSVYSERVEQLREEIEKLMRCFWSRWGRGANFTSLHNHKKARRFRSPGFLGCLALWVIGRQIKMQPTAVMTSSRHNRNSPINLNEMRYFIAWSVCAWGRLGRERLFRATYPPPLGGAWALSVSAGVVLFLACRYQGGD